MFPRLLAKERGVGLNDGGEAMKRSCSCSEESDCVCVGGVGVDMRCVSCEGAGNNYTHIELYRCHCVYIDVVVG